MTRRRIERRTLADHIAEQLRTEILSGNYALGGALPTQRQLAADFGASTNVVREALRTLQADGLIEVRHGAGTFVSNLPDESNLEAMDPTTLLEARCMLEVGAIEHVMRRIDAEGYGRLEAILERAADKVQRGVSVLEEELEFHRTLLELSGNVAVAHLGRIIEEFFRQAVSLQPEETAGVYPDFEAEHRHIVDLVRAGDIPAARRALFQHILAGGK